MEQRIKKRRRFRSFALSRDRVRSTGGAGIVRDTCNWLVEGSSGKKKRSQGRYGHEEEEEEDDDDEEEEKKRRRIPRKIAVARRRWSNQRELRHGKKDETNARNYSVRTMFKCPTRGEIREVVGRKERKKKEI